MTTTPRILRALLWAIPFVLIIVVVTLPVALQLALVAAAFTALVVAALPMKVVVFAWAALLPIWSIGTVDPLVFDIARAYIAILIFIKVGKGSYNSIWTNSTSRVAIPLGGVALTLTLVGILRPDSGTLAIGATMAMALAVGWLVLSRTDDPWPIFGGYLFGVTLSASVLLLAAFGVTTLTPQTDGGYFRLTGLAPSATLVTYQLAIGVVIAWAASGLRTRRTLYVLALIACLGALALSGGRGGVVALALAVCVAIRWQWFKILPAIALALLGWLGLSLAESAGITVNTVQRILESAQSGQSDSRESLLLGALHSVAANPVVGSGLESFESSYGASPHFAILTFFVAGGILCGTLIAWVSLAMVRRVALVSPRPFGASGKAAHLLLTVLFVSILLEPNGPFVGMELTTLLLLAVGATSQKLDTRTPISTVGLRAQAVRIEP